MKKYIGIDPGKSGGIACYSGKYKLIARKCPTTNFDMYLVLKSMIGDTPSNDVFVFIEQVWAFPSDSSKTAFTFGVNYGAWQMLCDIEELQVSLCRPRKWQSFVDTPKKLIKRDRKNWLKELAQKEAGESFRVTLATSDAILIAYFCKKMRGKL